MVYVKELLLARPLHLLLHRRCSRSCSSTKAKTLCFLFDHTICTILKLINWGSSVYKLVTLCRFNNSVLASISQMIVEIVIDGIVMATILAEFAFVRRLTIKEATLMLGAFDLFFLFMEYVWSGSLLDNFTPFSIVLFLSISLYKADSLLTELYGVFFYNIANAAQSDDITCV